MIDKQIIEKLKLSEFFFVNKIQNPVYQLDEGVLITYAESNVLTNNNTKLCIYSKHEGYTLVIDIDIHFLENKSRSELLKFIKDRNINIMQYYDENNIRGVIRYDRVLITTQ